MSRHAEVSGEDLDPTDSPGNTRRIRLPTFTHESVDERTIDILPSHSNLVPEGNLVTFKLKNPGFGDVQFDWLIVDEAHKVKKLSGSYYNMLRLFEWDSLVWVTGTPLFTSLRDLLAPLSLIWQKYKFDWIPDADIGWLPGLYAPSYDPTIEETEMDGRVVKGIFSQPYLEKHPALKRLRDHYFENHRNRSWMLSPHLLKMCGRELGWATDLGAQVVAHVMRVIEIKRTLRSSVVVPLDDAVESTRNGDADEQGRAEINGIVGKRVFPAQYLLPATIRVEEVGFRHGTADHEETLKELEEFSLKTFPFDDDEQVATPESGHEVRDNVREVKFNFSSHREAVFKAFDRRNVQVFDGENESVFGDPSDIKRHLKSSLISKPRPDGGLTPARQDQGGHDLPRLGVEHVDHLIKSNLNGGLTYLYQIARVDPEMPVPTERATFLQWLLAKSPVMIRAMRLCFEYVRKEKQRVLVFVDTPWIQR